ncbi:Exonuclease domain-containing protein [Mycena chlorophos]|uniref:RNA exonuclease 4 n=1 Tax=Mycena chlorophos TaxID=658473 RepID=A0A8H6RX98_MYCCL|nr:Exonuclease domain-containing protein [Mycena chlorophos]
MGKNSKSSAPASSNWLALQKVLKPARKTDHGDHSHARKRRKIQHSNSSASLRGAPSSSQRRPSSPRAHSISESSEEEYESEPSGSAGDMKNGESLSGLRKMIFGQVEYSDLQRQPGKYLALDCEMVGVGPEGAENSLARVSIVNYFGAVLLDEFVRQRERVVDYRTEFSGVRESDMVKAKPFAEIQARAAALLKDHILVGHAVHNDLKALLLTHPRPYTRDTQVYAGKFKLVKTKYVALRNLVKQEVGATIQGGEHSSVTDARATMAVFRLHRKEWEAGSAPWPPKDQTQQKSEDEEEPVQDDEQKSTKRKRKEKEFPGGGRKGVSSGLSVVVKRGGEKDKEKEKDKDKSRRKSGGSGSQWWKELGGGSSSKASIRV